MLIVRSALAVVAMVAMSVSSAASACGKFEGRLILEDVATNYPDHGAFDPGHTEFQLLSEYTFIGCDGTRYTIPTHREVGGEKVPTIVNGASIPKAIWSVVGGPWSGKYRNAAVIHDFMTEINFEDSDTTNRIFYDAMISNDVPEWKA